MAIMSNATQTQQRDHQPAPDCALCPRLYAFRKKNQEAFPDKFNAPVPSFGSIDAEILIVGLAPGLKGANFSGRPFTGDYAGDLLYPTLLKFGFARGEYNRHAQDGLEMVNTRITNAVRCVPPENKPTTPEIKQCLDFLKSEIAAMPRLKILIALGSIAHNAVLRTFDQKLSTFKFAHNASHDLTPYTLIDSYHCSRYNTQTGRLTTEMFEDVFQNASDRI